ncbi:flagellar protein FlaG [Fervidobacterium sp.]
MEGIKGVGRNPVEQELFVKNQVASAEPVNTVQRERVVLRQENDENQDIRKKAAEEIDLLKENLEKLKKIFRGEAEFKIDRETNVVVIKIKDPDTGEVIRQIPPELALKLSKNIQELLGVLMDERV